MDEPKLEWYQIAGTIAASLGLGSLFPKIVAWFGKRADNDFIDRNKSRDAHYEDLKAWITEAKEMASQAFALVKECENRHAISQKQNSDVVLEMAKEIASQKTELRLLSEAHKEMLTTKDKDSLMAGALAEVFKSHPALKESLLMPDLKEEQTE